MPPHTYKVLIVGLDGATFDLILPWVHEGHLPNLGRLLRCGTHSRLESTIPPITPCAWSSFMTGKNPGKHGLFDFIQPTPEAHGFQFTNASFREGETLWGCISRHGRKVGVVNVPMTYPPEKVNGFMISGLDTPHERSPFMYPTRIRDELKKANIRYRIDQQHLGNMRTDRRRQKQLRAIFDAETQRTSAFCHLSKAHPADFRMIVYGATDQVQHHFWHYMDENHDKYDARGAKHFRYSIRDTYIHVDKLLGQLLKECDEETVVVIMSDHGFGPTTGVRLRLNQVLRNAGLLQFNGSTPSKRLFQGFARRADAMLRGVLSPDMKRTLAGLFPKLRVWFENLDETSIDWLHTTAYVNEAYRSSPAVWLNPDYPITRIEADAIYRRIQTALLGLEDPATRRPAISRCFRPRDIYRGPHAQRAPELLPSWWEDGFLLEQSASRPLSASDVERTSSPVQGGIEFSGSHRLDGIFIASGGPVQRGGVFTDAQIVDVAPTVLYLMGLPIPDDMDGRVLTEAIDRDCLEANPPQWETRQEDGNGSNRNQQAFTNNESDLIARRLQALGYIN